VRSMFSCDIEVSLKLFLQVPFIRRNAAFASARFCHGPRFK
jgi:hypothetical protein